MKFLEYLFKFMNSKAISYFDYFLLAFIILYAFYGFFISSEAPGFWDWLNLFILPIAILTTVFKPSKYIGKAIGMKAKKRN